MPTHLHACIDRIPEYTGPRGLTRLAKELVCACEAPPEETCLPANATREQHKAAAKIGRAWHRLQAAKRRGEIEELLSGKPGKLSRAEREKLAEIIGLPREAAEKLHEEEKTLDIGDPK